MAKPYKSLQDKMSPERQTAASQRSARMLLEVDLQELRQRCTDLTQKDVAALLAVTQAYVSKFERREDTLISSLYAHVKALGGELELRVRVPGHDEVRVTQYEDVVRIREAIDAK